MTPLPRAGSRVLDTLRARLIVSHVLVAVVVIVLAAVTLVVLLDGYRERLSEATLREVAAPIALGLGRIATAGEARPLLAFLDSRTTDAGVGAAFVTADGRVIIETGDTSEADLADETFDLPPVETLRPQGDELYSGELELSGGGAIDFVVIPLPPRVRRSALGQQTGEATGAPVALVLFVSQDSAADLIREDLAPRLMLAGGAGLAVALLLGLVLARWIYRPLGRLREAANAVAAGDLAAKAGETGPRETRELAADFNRMTDEVAAGRTALRDFLLDASHELRTPLTSIRGFSQALSDGTIDDDAGRVRAGEVIQSETERLLRLVDDLSDLSRLEAGQTQLSAEAVDVEAALMYVAELFGPAAGRAGAEVGVRVEGAVLAVRADADKLEQVISNLVDNALRHLEQGGHVLLTARPGRGRFVEIAVSDDGPGIPADELERVFDRFYRRARGNSGLGLAICRELVRAHGGDIWAERAGERGTRVAFTLPVEAS